jgi:hypothetical protein
VTGSVTESAIGDALLKFTSWAVENDGLGGQERAGRQGLGKIEGPGIVISQPDTGIASHAELEQGGVFDLTKAKNILDGSNAPPKRSAIGRAIRVTAPRRQARS